MTEARLPCLGTSPRVRDRNYQTLPNEARINTNNTFTVGRIAGLRHVREITHIFAEIKPVQGDIHIVSSGVCKNNDCYYCRCKKVGLLAWSFVHHPVFWSSHRKNWERYLQMYIDLVRGACTIPAQSEHLGFAKKSQSSQIYTIALIWVLILSSMWKVDNWFTTVIILF